jgi:hypothetical protein
MPMRDESLEFYQMGEEGNARDAYELHTTRNMKRLVFRDFTVSNKYPNNIVLAKDLGVCVVHDIRYDRYLDSFQVSLSPFTKQEDFYQGAPCNSSEFNIFMVSGGMDITKRKTVDSRQIKNQFVCLMYEKVVNIQDAQPKNIQQQENQPAAAARANLDKQKSVFVCVPLMHGLFE